MVTGQRKHSVIRRQHPPPPPLPAHSPRSSSGVHTCSGTQPPRPTNLAARFFVDERSPDSRHGGTHHDPPLRLCIPGDRHRAVASFRPLSALKRRPPTAAPATGDASAGSRGDRKDRRVRARLVSPPRTAAGQVRRGAADPAALEALEVRDAPPGARLLLGHRTGAWCRNRPAGGRAPPRPHRRPELTRLEARYFADDVLGNIRTLRWEISQAWIDEWLAEQQRRRASGRLRCLGDGRHSFPIW